MPDADNLPIFVPDNADDILNRLKNNYEGLANKNLLPAQNESLLLQTIGYEVKMIRDSFNAGGRMMLIRYSEGPMLDELVYLLGLVRLAAQGAGCTIRFQLVAGHAAVTIPSGTRVQSGDGKAAFRTIVDASAVSSIGNPTPTTYLDIPCECITPGIVGNGYTAGLVSTILDPLPFVSSAANTTTSTGGSDGETDEQLRERFYLAPYQFSNAGSEEAYKFWARTASSSIIDVTVTMPVAGTVRIYPLVAGGIATPTNILDAVSAACNAKRVRPLTDTVEVQTPVAVDYDIIIELAAYNSYDDATVLANVNAVINTFIELHQNTLGVDIVRAELVRIAKEVPGVYDVGLSEPASNITIDPSEFALTGGTHGTVNIFISTHSNG